MKSFKTDIKKIITVIAVLGIVASMSACSKKKDAKDTTAESEATTTTPVVTTAAPTTMLTTYSGPETTYDGEISVSENTIEQTIMYANVSEGEFLNVRVGPGVDYDKAGTLTRNQQIVVVALCSNGWYKTSDGFYISGDFLSANPV